MKRAICIILFNVLMNGILLPQSQINPAYFNNSHDISSLQKWGPYSKRYAGISHIQHIKSGIRFDFSVMPGYYRNKQSIPHVLFESAYFPWKINPEMTHITYRYELEWKDQVYVDVTYHMIDSLKVLTEIKCVNNTASYQNLTLNNMAYIDYAESYPEVKAENSKKLQWINAVNYTEATSVDKSSQYNLVYDGWKRFEERTSNSIDGSIVARNFGKNQGDKLCYTIPITTSTCQGQLCFRYKVASGKMARFIAKGIIDTTLVFKGTGEFITLNVSYKTKPENNKLELTSTGDAPIELDGFYVGDKTSIENLRITDAPRSFIPRLYKNEQRQDILLKYNDLDEFYGISWNYPESEIREVLNDELESFFRRKTHDHVSKKLIGNGKWHYTNAFLRPIVLEPKQQKTLYLLLATGDSAKVATDIERFHNLPQELVSQIDVKTPKSNLILPEGEKYSFGYQLLQASILSNVVYPVYTQQEYIRHFTPGKNWNSLYTWDSGFIALGLIDIDPLKAFECVRAYTTEVGAQSAFIHHGTPLPIQFFAYYDLWNEISSKPMLQFLYPRLKQYFEFMVGLNPTSTTRMKGTNLLKSWDYFYNSGGWDDYPPQKSPHGNNTTPVVTTAFYIRAAKILRMAASELGYTKDIKLYDEQIKALSDALQKYAWDDEAGYYSYVQYNKEGDFEQIYRYSDGSNYNKGLDGTSPLISGICTKGQTEKLLGHLFNEKELWTSIGLSTVDRTATYYKTDGYWNGAVWMPHQWTTWKSLLDNGKGDLAYRLAMTALGTWEKECRESYYTFEHFIISSGRGAGWHQFSGLSSPIINWYTSYYKIGKVTTGFEVWLSDNKFNSDFSAYQATLKFDGATNPHERNILICLNPNYNYIVTIDGKQAKTVQHHVGCLQIILPSSNKTCKLVISKNKE